MQVRFKLEKETKGALRYQEVDDKGEPIEHRSARSTSARVPSNGERRSRRPYGSPLNMMESGTDRGLKIASAPAVAMVFAP